jgi:hypothetical protein
VDLVKAFDKIVREVALGMPAHVSDPLQYLQSLGLSHEQSMWIAAWVSRHGSQFRQWGMPEKLVRLLQNLHVMSWFTYGEAETAVSVLIGGRQGCKFGAAVFNSTFALAATLLYETLSDAGVMLTLLQGPPTFWGQEPPVGSPEVSSIDVCFVDDEAFFVTAASPRLLDLAVDVLLGAVDKIYGIMALQINLLPKKTEAFLLYRGHGATS